MKKYGYLKTLGKQFIIIKERKAYYIYFLWGLCAIFGGFVPVGSAFFSKIIIDIITGANSQSLIPSVIILTLICGGSYAITSISNAFLEPAYLNLRFGEFERCIYYNHNMDYEKVENSSFQDDYMVATQALDSDGRGFEAVYFGIARILTSLVTIGLFCYVLSSFSWIIATICLVFTIVTAITNQSVAKYCEKRSKDLAHTSRQKYYFNQTCSDFSYGKDIRIFGLKNSLIQKYKSKSLNYYNVLKAIYNRSFLYGLIGLLVLLIQDSVSYFLIIYAYFKGDILISDVSLYITVIVLLTTTLREIVDHITKLNANIRLSSKYFDILLNEEETIKGTYKESQLKQGMEIEFVNVWFKYPNTEKWILKDFNFKIEAFEKLAIVGVNGAGKSTIVKLICGLFKPTKGQILINGIDICEYDQDNLYQQFSTVFQDYDIYACSILENVIGKDSDEESRKRGIDCINRVGLEKKINSLPNKYDTQVLKVVDENGVDLSGGERQKLAIARALYKDGKAVILDEPTSALDALAEAEIYQSFDDLVENKTAIYVSHRLASTKFCDKIAFFTENGLEEYGTHEELMNLQKGYFEMFKIQGQYYQNGGEVNEEYDII